MASPSLIFLILMISSLSRAVYGVILDVRLVNGNKPNEGTIMYTEDCLTWHISCGQHQYKRNEADVICRHLGYPASNQAIRNSPYGDYGSPSTQIKCNGDENNVSKCNVTECSSGTPGGVICYENNYIGCFVDNPSTRVLRDRKNMSFIGLTIDKCLEFCLQHSSMAFAGIENSHECYCSNDSMANLTIHGQRATDQECNYVCDGSKYESCGGLNRIAIFNLTAPPPLSPYPMDSPCDTTTPPISTMASEVTEIVKETSQESPASTKGLRTSDMSEDGSNTPSGSSAFTETVSGPDRTSSSNSRTPNAALYGAIGGGVAVVVGVIVVIIIIIVLRHKLKEKEDQKYGVCEMTKTTSESPGYENSIVGFHEATDGDTTDDLYGVVEKDAFSAQMKRGTMIVDYVNVKGEAGNTPAVVEPDHSYENMAADTTGNDKMASKDVGGSDELYANVTCGTR